MGNYKGYLLSQAEANARYRKKYDFYNVRFPKENDANVIEKKRCLEYAEKKGVSLNTLILTLLKNEIENNTD